MANKYQEALDIIDRLVRVGGAAWIIGNKYDEYKKSLQELVDKATPKKLIKLEIIELDKIIMPEYTNLIEKYMCDECGLTWFIVDGHTCQNKFCKQCGQAIDWSKDE